jgi:GNAT superfamily N-acetyltransferase
MDPVQPVTLRAATEHDASLLLELIRELAEYERLLHQVRATEERLRETLFSEPPSAEAWIAELDGVAVGFALFFQNYSTFLAQPGIYLEDLYVRPQARGRGVGRALLERVAQLAVERSCGRLEWAVLDWNEPALEFYRSLGAAAMSDWTIHRVAGPALEALARGREAAPVRVRSATITDAEAIAAVHVHAWRVAYRGLMPDHVLEGLEEAQYVTRWRRWLDASTTNVFVAADGDRVVGFTSFQPARDADVDASEVAEIPMLYVDPALWRSGVGTALLARAIGEVRARSFRTVVLWVLETNAAARSFYESRGFVNDGTTKNDVLLTGTLLPEVRYRKQLDSDARVGEGAPCPTRA